MTMAHGRRVFVLGLAAAPVTLVTSPLTAQARTIWSADEAYDALLADSARVIDVRSREDWLETGRNARTTRIVSSTSCVRVAGWRTLIPTGRRLASSARTASASAPSSSTTWIVLTRPSRAKSSSA